MNDESANETSPLIRVAIVIGILVISGGIAAAFIASRKEPKKTPRENKGILVRVESVAAKSQQLEVQAQGNVIAARRVAVQPQVAGEVVFVSEKLVPGGIVEKGDLLVRIEAADYRLSVAEARASVKQAKAQLALEQGQQRVAQKEWDLFKDDFDSDATAQEEALALRGPQLESARVAVEAAEARLQRAQLNLRRTTIRAPFNAIILTDNVDIGQFVTSQAQMATLADADVAWIQASVPVEEISDIALPGINAEEGSEAKISLDSGATKASWTGRVIRLLGELDPQGRMARVLIEVPRPMGSENEAGIPLLLGSYVSVTFGATETTELVEISREALRDGDKVWIFDSGELDVRDVVVAWRRPETVLLSAGVDDGDLIVMSQISAPVDGMKLRLGDDDESEGSTTARVTKEASDE